ncbi:MAG: AAA family ATPase [Verrucomicrobia bacterium]|nr:AAA family ATPase [Verrucomicrobiota bacterium]
MSATGENLPLQMLLDFIRAGNWTKQITALRAADKPAREKMKRALPAVMLSGSTRGGHKASDVLEHSGLLQIDLDHVGNAAALRDQIGKDQHILAAWISPSGDGVKAIMRIPSDIQRHKDAFLAAADHIYRTHALKIDPSCSDVNRLCFVSSDPDLVMNPGAVPLEVPVEVPRLAPVPPQGAGTCAAILERARVHLATVAPAVSGQSGHTVTFKAAIDLVRGYNLSEEDAYPLLAEWNQRCEPPWSEKELRHKISESANKSTIPRGYLLSEREPLAPSVLPLIRSIQELTTMTPDLAATLLGERLLCRGGAMLMVGPSGVGKSTMSMHQDLCWAVGREAFGIKPAQPLRILTIQAENDDGDLNEMSRGVYVGLHITPEEWQIATVNLHYVTEIARSGAAFLDMLDRLLIEHACDIVRIDPLFAFYGAKIEDSEKLSAFLRGGINPILHKHNVGLILAHHTPKTNNRDTSCWTHTDYSYAGAGGAELTNWARAMLVLDATHTPGTFKLIAAKRGARIGWRDSSGAREFIRYFRHSRKEGIIFWEEGDEDEVACDEAKKKASKRRPNTIDPMPLIEQLVPPSIPIEKGALLAEVNKNGAGQKAAIDALQRLLNSEKPLFYEHREKRKPGRDRILIARYKQSEEGHE